MDAWPSPAQGSGRFHPLLVGSAGGLAAGIEICTELHNSCIAFDQSYQTYPTVPGCSNVATYIQTQDSLGRFQIQRQGGTVRTFYRNGAWIQALPDRSIPTGPMSISLVSGTNGSLTSGHQASYDNISVISSNPTGAGNVSGLVLAKELNGNVMTSWGSSSAHGDADYEVYEGRLGISSVMSRRPAARPAP